MMTTDRYAAWIAEYVARCDGKIMGQCASAVAEMRIAFPELRAVRGHVVDGLWGRRAHWWCVAANDQIVDPTRTQFPALFDYEEWTAGDPVRVGRCMNCGEDIYETPQSLDEVIERRSVCGDKCERELIEATS